MEMKSILKSDRSKFREPPPSGADCARGHAALTDSASSSEDVLRLKAQDHSTKQSSSIGAVRWCLPEEDIQAHNSAPSRPVASGKLTGHSHVSKHFGFYFIYLFFLLIHRFETRFFFF